jgi:hypothetical protein
MRNRSLDAVHLPTKPSSATSPADGLKVTKDTDTGGESVSFVSLSLSLGRRILRLHLAAIVVHKRLLFDHLGKERNKINPCRTAESGWPTKAQSSPRGEIFHIGCGAMLPDSRKK